MRFPRGSLRLSLLGELPEGFLPLINQGTDFPCKNIQHFFFFSQRPTGLNGSGQPGDWLLFPVTPIWMTLFSSISSAVTWEWGAPCKDVVRVSSEWCCCSVGKSWLTATPWTAAHQASLSSAISQSLLRLMSIESVMPSSHLILCCPLLLLPTISPSVRNFFDESVLRIRWPNYWNFSFSISPATEYSGLF